MSGTHAIERNNMPALEGGIRGLPPSMLRQVSAIVAQGTLAASGHILSTMPWEDSSRQDRAIGLALSQMWAQARLMGVVMGGNRLITQWMHGHVEASPNTNFRP